MNVYRNRFLHAADCWTAVFEDALFLLFEHSNVLGWAAHFQLYRHGVQYAVDVF